MKKILGFTLLISALIFGCRKDDSAEFVNQNDNLSEKAIIINKDIKDSEIISSDSTKIILKSNGDGVNKIVVGSVLYSDMSKFATNGFLLKVTSVQTSGAQKILTTEQASLTDILKKCSVQFSKTFTDSDIMAIDTGEVNNAGGNAKGVNELSFKFSFDKVVYDNDKNILTTYDQVHIKGDIIIIPTFDFSLEIENSSITKLQMKLILNSTSTINAETGISLAEIKKEILIKRFLLSPLTIPVGPIGIPVASQWIAIVLGVDGQLSAKVTAGAQNIYTSEAGVLYENSSWKTINNQNNSFTLLPLTFEGDARIEPWLQLRYEIRPFALRTSRIYLGIRGSVIGEAIIIPSGLSTTIKWGIKFSALAQAQIFDRAVLDYDKVFYEQEFPIYQKNTFAFPTITTTDVSNITNKTSLSGGIISSDGGSLVISRGVCWNISGNPTIIDNKTTDGTGTGPFTSVITDLNPTTVYYLKAYATNSAGTAYGSEIKFRTIGGEIGTVTDIEGYTYKTVGIGSQTWMAQNLKTTFYNDGTPIPLSKDLLYLINHKTPEYLWNYFDNGTTDSLYGVWYNWYAVESASNGGRNICPSGWHVPSDNDWIILTSYLGGEALAGDKLKETGYTHWTKMLSSTATNETGFTALPGAYIYGPAYACCKGQNGNWWSSTQSDIQSASSRQIQYISSAVQSYVQNKYVEMSVRCIKDPDNFPSIPVLTTIDVSDITQYTASSGGAISSDGGSPVTERGVCWAQIPDPVITNDYKLVSGTGSGEFSCQLTDLIANTAYYIRSYATNSAGTGYGKVISFKTGGGKTGSVSDAEGHAYQTIEIGAQTWMAENLRSTIFNDNTPIQMKAYFMDWSSTTSPAYSWPSNDPASKYGVYYNGYVANSVANGDKNVCPVGWHVPSDDDWTGLTDYLVNNRYGFGGSGIEIANSMAAQTGWKSYYPSTNCPGTNPADNNKSGFSALAGGGRDPGGSTSYIIGWCGYWWTSSMANADVQWYRSLSFSSSVMIRNSGYKNNGFSIRCLKDN